MNQRIKQLLAVAFLATSAGLDAKSLNYFAGKGFGNSMSRELTNVSQAWKNEANDGWFGKFSVTGQYNQSFKNDRSTGLGALMSFGGSTTNVMTVGGGAAGALVDATYNIDGYQLGLGERVAGSLKMQLNPKLYQAGADFQLFVGSSQYEPGFYFKAKTAVGVASVDPKLTETGSIGAVAAANTGYIANSFGKAVAVIADTAVYSKMSEAFNPSKAISTNYKQMTNGLIAGKQTTGAKVGDVELALGYNFVANDDYTVGLGVRGSLPTGNKPTGKYALEPVFGRGGHWGLGGEAFVRANLYSSEDGEKSVNFWMNGYAQHLFKADQKRSFDTTLNGEGSRYMLVAKYGTDETGSLATSYAKSSDDVQNLINHSTLACDTTVDVEGAVAVMFEYNCCNWNMGLGGEFWGASKEKVTITGSLPTDLVVIGRQIVGTATGSAERGLCQPNATMNKQTALSATATGDVKYASFASSKIKQSDLNADSAANAARYSGKVFGNVGYAWTDSEYCPQVSLTGEAEFGASKTNTVSQWGVAVQGGICF
jgi:hypothetical protein